MRRLICLLLISTSIFLSGCWRNGSGNVEGVLINKSEEGILFTTGTLHLRTSDNSSSTIVVCAPWGEIKDMRIGDAYNISYYKRVSYFPSESCEDKFLGVMDSYQEIAE